MTYDELNVYLEDVECQKALLMLEAVNEMDSGIYMESGENIIQKVIARLKKLFESIKDWFSKHFRRNKVAKGTTIRMSRSEYKKINDEYKFSQKLKQAVKNPKNWAVLIGAAGTIGFGVGFGISHKKNKSLEKSNNSLAKSNKSLETSNKEKDDTIIVKDAEIDELKEKVSNTMQNLDSVQKRLNDAEKRFSDKLSDVLHDKKLEAGGLRNVIVSQSSKIEHLQDDNKRYQNLLATHAENEARLAQQLDDATKKANRLDAGLKSFKNESDETRSKLIRENQKLREELDQFQKMASITEKAGTSSMQHAQKLEAKIEKAKVEDVKLKNPSWGYNFDSEKSLKNFKKTHDGDKVKVASKPLNEHNGRDVGKDRYIEVAKFHQDAREDWPHPSYNKTQSKFVDRLNFAKEDVFINESKKRIKNSKSIAACQDEEHGLYTVLDQMYKNGAIKLEKKHKLEDWVREIAQKRKDDIKDSKIKVSSDDDNTRSMTYSLNDKIRAAMKKAKKKAKNK